MFCEYIFARSFRADQQKILSREKCCYRDLDNFRANKAKNRLDDATFPRPRIIFSPHHEFIQ